MLKLRCWETFAYKLNRFLFEHFRCFMRLCIFNECAAAVGTNAWRAQNALNCKWFWNIHIGRLPIKLKYLHCYLKKIRCHFHLWKSQDQTTTPNSAKFIWNTPWIDSIGVWKSQVFFPFCKLFLIECIFLQSTGNVSITLFHECDDHCVNHSLVFISRLGALHSIVKLALNQITHSSIHQLE